MQYNIHPKYNSVKVKCACKNTVLINSTIDGEELKVEICSKCHPFYTGQHKIVDTGGMVQRFEKKYPAAYSQKTDKTDQTE